MKPKYRKLDLFLFLLVIATGCVAWEKVGGPYEMRDDSYEVNLPANWYRSVSTKNALLVTRDGTTLQYIEIVRLSIESGLNHTKRKLVKDMSPLDASELVSDDLRANTTLLNPQVIENIPAAVGGAPGFKLVYSFQTRDGLQRKGVQYGMVRGSFYYGLRYSAVARHYFERDLATFEKVKESFKIRS